ncbi:serine/threonine protein kinase [Polytolypa hystricis UAMH7299]|uniref:Serine/threonine protein kinase n=1 Tax=Polytolypa hystricis (strain UAMH7299) TaxID=1447883 RepID=A0A2B7YQ18_POLH7|nr:serine/threonine protein kinase [Polytolypa hystricis UAMH7299]
MPHNTNLLVVERRILQKLDDRRHIIRCVKSYQRGDLWGLVLEPVADGYLSSLLSDTHGTCGEEKAFRYRNLMKSFGCLARSLEHIHSNQIRHRDIKPDNILYLEEDGSYHFIWIDFGVSNDTGSATTDFQNLTPRYSAPEYIPPEITTTSPSSSASQMEHHFPADIFSFGVVVLEILSLLIGEHPSTADTPGAFHQCALEPMRFCDAIDDLKRWAKQQIDKNKHITHHRRLKILLETAAKMIDRDPDERPTAGEVARIFFSEDASLFCAHCKKELHDSGAATRRAPVNGHHNPLSLMRRPTFVRAIEVAG